MTAIVIVIVVLVVIIVLWVFSTQRKLVKMDEICSNALSQIGVQLTSRWDLIGALVKMTKSYAEHEYRTLSEVIANRSGVNSNATPTAADVNSQESQMGQIIGRINAVAEQYPDLKANQTYLDTMGKMQEYEENVRMSRMVYNDTVTKINRMIRQIPESLIAGHLGFSVREYLKVDEKKEEYPEINI
jgi:LemA protein